MARILDTTILDPHQPYPSLGSILGTGGADTVFESLNQMGFQSFFGSELDDARNDFFTRHVASMDRVSIEIRHAVNSLFNPDHIRILESIEDFRSIPLCMELAIATFEPVRQGIIEGRYEGFGYDPETLGEDFFGRLIANTSCDDVGEVIDEEGYFPLEATIYSDDPEYTDDELYAIQRTREYILNKIIAEGERDPTAIDLPSG